MKKLVIFGLFMIGILLIYYNYQENAAINYEQSKKEYLEKIHKYMEQERLLKSTIQKLEAKYTLLKKINDAWQQAYFLQKSETNKALAYAKKVDSPGFEFDKPELKLNLDRFIKAIKLETEGRQQCEEREKTLKLSLTACKKLCEKYKEAFESSHKMVNIADQEIKRKKKSPIIAFIGIAIGAYLLGKL